jgi:hypothetical protein
VSNVCQECPHSQVHSALGGGSHSHWGQKISMVSRKAVEEENTG